MNTAQKIASNTAGQVIFRTIDVALGVLTLALITRYLGQEGFGHYATITAFLQLFIIVIDFGLYLTLLKELSSAPPERQNDITNSILTLRFITSAVFIALACITVFYLPYPSVVRLGVIISSVGALLTTLMSTVTALFQKHLQMIRLTAATLVYRVLFFVITLAVISGSEGLLVLLVGSSLSMIPTIGAIWYLARRLPVPARIRFRWDPVYTKRVISISWPIAVTTALNLIYFRADTIILSLFQSASEVGIYGASYRVIEILTTFPHMFMGLVMPLMTAAWVAGNREQLARICERTVSFFILLTFPLITIIAVLATPIMSFLAGPDFSASGPVLRILIIATAAIFFGTFFLYLVIVLDRQRAMIKYFALTAALALVGYLILIPRFSYWGAAWITLGSEMLISVTAAAVALRLITFSIPRRTVIASIIACILTGGVLYAVAPLMHVVASVILGLTVYALVAFALGAVSRRDIAMLFNRSYDV